jgi:hypothetical protein
MKNIKSLATGLALLLPNLTFALSVVNYSLIFRILIITLVFASLLVAIFSIYRIRKIDKSLKPKNAFLKIFFTHLFLGMIFTVIIIYIEIIFSNILVFIALGLFLQITISSFVSIKLLGKIHNKRNFLIIFFSNIITYILMFILTFFL